MLVLTLTHSPLGLRARRIPHAKRSQSRNRRCERAKAAGSNTLCGLGIREAHAEERERRPGRRRRGSEERRREESEPKSRCGEGGGIDWRRAKRGRLQMENEGDLDYAISASEILRAG